MPTVPSPPGIDEKLILSGALTPLMVVITWGLADLLCKDSNSKRVQVCGVCGLLSQLFIPTLVVLQKQMVWLCFNKTLFRKPGIWPAGHSLPKINDNKIIFISTLNVLTSFTFHNNSLVDTFIIPTVLRKKQA